MEGPTRILLTAGEEDLGPHDLEIRVRSEKGGRLRCEASSRMSWLNPFTNSHHIRSSINLYIDLLNA